MDKPLQGKTAIVTGGARGIGAAISLGLAAQGANVMVGYLSNHARATETVTMIAQAGGHAQALQSDISNESEAIRLFDEAEKNFGAIDIVVANAADILVKPLAETTLSDYERIFGLNTRGVYFTLREAARRLQEGGRIIVTSSGGTKMFFPGQTLYLGSKGAIEQFARSLAWELGPRLITVNTVSPGPTETEMMQEQYRDRAAAMSPFNRIGRPDEVAAAALFLASDEARWITGQNIGVGGGAF